MSAGTIELDREIRNCTRCAAVLAIHPENPPTVMRKVQPRPILSEPMRAQVMLVGQAPGLTEYETGRPFSGPAGDGIRKLFSGCGVHPANFDRVVYQTSAVKCFPGRKKNNERWEDRPPCAKMQRYCSAFLERQINAVQPNLIVAMGGVATKVFDKLMGFPHRRLFDAVGTSEKWNGITVIYLTHTSGGNRSLNPKEKDNRAEQERAISIIASELAQIGI